jgi:hypothetical protein
MSEVDYDPPLEQLASRKGDWKWISRLILGRFVVIFIISYTKSQNAMKKTRKKDKRE